MEIRNGMVFEPEGYFRPRDVFTENGRISRQPSGEILDARGLYVLPGLVDIHIHGWMGADFSDGDPRGLRKMAEGLLREGVTSFLPTAMSSRPEELKAAARALAQYEAHPAPLGAVPRGVHLEGPFLSPKKRGAQEESRLLAPDPAYFRQIQALFAQKLRLVDLGRSSPAPWRSSGRQSRSAP